MRKTVIVDIDGTVSKVGDRLKYLRQKPEQLEKAGVSLKDIAFVLEDRNSMVKMWRELGVKCLQVAEGDF